MSNSIKEIIKETYTRTLDQDGGCKYESGRCGSGSPDAGNFAEDYSQLAGYIPEADYGLGCGLPTESALMRAGDTVLDLGSGAGNDVFVARRTVGDKGRVIGIGMTTAMIEKANSNKAKLGYKNVEFILGDIEEMPVASDEIDVVISNCVLNLVNDKAKTYKEIHRVLKPQGRFSISDIVVSRPLTKEIAAAVALYAGCISGAMVKENYLETIRQAGFKEIHIVKEKSISLPDNFLLNHLSKDALIEFRESGVQVLSVTITGTK